MAAGAEGACAVADDGMVVGWGGAEEICAELVRFHPILDVYLGLLGGVCGVSERGLVSADFNSGRSLEVRIGPQLLRVECPGDGRLAAETVDQMLRGQFASRPVPAGPIRDFSLEPFGDCAYWIDGGGVVRGRCLDVQRDSAFRWEVFTGRYVELASFPGGACAIDESGALECHHPAPDLFGVESDLQLTGLTVNDDVLCGLDERGFAHCFNISRYGSDNPLLHPPDVSLRSVSGTAGTNCALTLDEGRIVCWGNLEDGLGAPP